LPEVSPDQWRAIREDEPAERLVQALRSVITDPASRRYLEGLVAPVPAGEGSGRSASSASPLSSSAADEGAAGNADYLSVHVYGGKAALCFNADTTRGGVPTVALDAAAGANRQYDWAGKVRLQLTRQELPIVAAVLLGYRQACEFKSHGANKDKGFSMERQDRGRVFVRVFAREQGVKAVPIEVGDAFYVGGLFLRQLGKVMPWLDSTGIMMSLRAVVRD
jgi:hypothetical protein